MQSSRGAEEPGVRRRTGEGAHEMVVWSRLPALGSGCEGGADGETRCQGTPTCAGRCNATGMQSGRHESSRDPGDDDGGQGACWGASTSFSGQQQRQAGTAMAEPPRAAVAERFAECSRPKRTWLQVRGSRRAGSEMDTINGAPRGPGGAMSELLLTSVGRVVHRQPSAAREFGPVCGGRKREREREREREGDRHPHRQTHKHTQKERRVVVHREREEREKQEKREARREMVG